MFIEIDLTSRTPIYEQLKSSITRLAVLGILKPNEQLPSVRNLAKQLIINPNTVSKAYQILEIEEIIYSVPGRGCFISEKAISNKNIEANMLSKLKASLEECKNMGISKDMAIPILDEVYGGTYDKDRTSK